MGTIGAVSSTSAAPDLSVFIADDHKIIRDGLRVLLEREKGFTMVGEAADGRAVVDRVLPANPDVLIVDLAMPELNGIEAVRQLRLKGYTGIVVMLSMHDERRYIAQAIEAGINAYVHKDHAFQQVVTAITNAREGRAWLSPELTCVNEFGGVSTLHQLLTMREREVLQLFAEGQGTKEIAFNLKLSPKTVEAHRIKLYAKLKVQSVADLTRIAIREGLVQP